MTEILPLIPAEPVNEKVLDLEFAARSKALDVAVTVSVAANARGNPVSLTEVANEAYAFITSGILGPQVPTVEPLAGEALFTEAFLDA